ncbi:VaFE repeat-containing surface-anchored protein [Cumulibacter soli]|uniref:VaFE repeat-containing surface-anchored protein n=1 Tax=Cumulibacter soli TaxID=2546344 RepID=UPI001067DC1E|nr:VaFE repeat-containing surface-anchored protein [Cumulibacter soli]
MRILRSILTLAAACACALLPTAAFAEPNDDPPTFIAGDIEAEGLQLKLPGQPAFGTFTYAATSADGEHITGYCIDLDANYHPGAALTESDWSTPSAITQHADKINWLLHQSYPFVPLAQIWPGAGFNNGLSEAEAVTATQAAVWHYSNGLDLTEAHIVGTATERQDVLALYGHLTGPANTGQPQIPTGTLSLTADGTGGVSGTLIGPVTLDASEPTTLTLDGPPGGVELVDADGAPLDTETMATDFYLDVPLDTPAGSVMVTASATTHAQTSRLFMPTGAQPATQPLVAASLTSYPMHATITIPWTPAPALITSATDAEDGDQRVRPGGTVHDQVAYSDFVPGTEYTLVGELIDVDTGESTGASGSTTFTPTSEAGSTQVTIPVPHDAVPGTQLVVFERAYDAEGNLVAEHTDIAAVSQTVTIDTPLPVPPPDSPAPVTPESVTPEPVTPEPVTPEPVAPQPDTGEQVTPEPVLPEPAAVIEHGTDTAVEMSAEEDQLAETGTSLGPWILLSGTALLVGAGTMVLARRAR